MVIRFEWCTMAIGIARDPYGLRQLGQYRGKGDSMIEGELLQKKDKMYRILLSIVHAFYMENDDEKFPAHYTWKVAEQGFKMASMMNKLAIINSCEISLEKLN
jgi:hypothetical protein